MQSYFRKLLSKFGVLDLMPMRDWHTNSRLVSKTKGIDDLPVTSLGEKTISVWAVPFKARLLVLLTGKVNLQVMAEQHAPVRISIGEYEKSDDYDYESVED